MNIKWNNVLIILTIWITLGLFSAALFFYIFRVYNLVTTIFLGLTTSFTLILILAARDRS